MIRNKSFHIIILFLITVSNLFFGWGFQNLTVFNVPIIYFLLIAMLININFKNNSQLFRETGIFNILTIYLIFNLIKIVLGYNKYGIIALRDATFILDSFFIIAFIPFFKSDSINYKVLNKIFNFCFILLFFFVLTWFYQDFFITFSPKIISPIGSQTNLFFNYSTFNFLLFFFAFYSYFFLQGDFRKKFFFLLFSILTFVLDPKRTIYFSYFSIVIFLLFIDKKNIKLFIGIIIFLIFIQIINLFNLLPNLKYQNMNFFDFFINHLFSSIPGYSIEGEYFQSTQSTVTWRLEKWQQTINYTFENNIRLLFGTNYGAPLTNFVNVERIITREPHNIYVSVFARTGIIGSILFFILHYKIFRIFINVYKKTIILKLDDLKKIVLFLSIYTLFVFISGIFTASLSTVYFSSQFYIFAGLILSIDSMLKNYKKNF